MTRSVFWRHLRLPLAAGACLAALSAVALGVLPQQQGTVDLLTQANVTLNSAATGDQSGYSVASAGDVNGDGRTDVIVGAPLADPSLRSDAGSSYVIYGKASPSNVDLASLGSGGFRIDGAAGGGQVSALPAPAAQPAAPTSAPAAQPAALKVRMTCKGTVCTTRGTLPAGATRIGQSATAVGKKAARAKCSVKATGKGKKIKRTFACRLGVKKGTWTVTTSARAKNGTIVAQSVVTKRVK